MDTKTPVLQVQMFSSFSVMSEDATLNEENIRSEMMTKLFIYILCHRKKEITVQELSEVLWEEDESDNPAGALKNLMYRLRTLIKKKLGDGDFILTGRSAYSWNPKIPVIVDVEVFEEHIKNAEMQVEPAKKVEQYKAAFELYKGELLPKFTNEYWIASLSTYYHTTYINAVKKTAQILQVQGRYTEMASCCSRALQIDNLDENLHSGFIQALIGQDNYKQALEQYRIAEKTLYDYLGITPSDELRGLYETIIKHTHRYERDITAVQKELNEEEMPGAYICEYGAFQRIYRLQLRQGERMGISIFLLLVTISADEVLEKNSKHKGIMRDAMEHLEDVLRTTLRSGDPVAQYSGSQYVALLPTCQYETAKIVESRVRSAFWNNYKNRHVTLRFDLDELGRD